MKKLMITVALLGLAIPFTADAKPLKQANHKKTTAVSGYTGKTKTMWTSQALTGIKWEEAGDAACLFKKIYRYLSDVTGKNKTDVNQTSIECGRRRGMGPAKTVQFTGDYFINALQVCTSLDKSIGNRRLKGIKVYAARVQSSPIKITQKSTVVSKATRTNCKKWHKKVSCGDRRIAYGLVIHRGDAGAYGIALQCTDVMAR